MRTKVTPVKLFKKYDTAPLSPAAGGAAAVGSEAIAGGAHGEIEEEIGDLLFVIANLARHLSIDPEKALRGTNAKFVRRFRHIERTLESEGRTPADASLDEMDQLWNEARAADKAAKA